MQFTGKKDQQNKRPNKIIIISHRTNILFVLEAKNTKLQIHSTPLHL